MVEVPGNPIQVGLGLKHGCFLDDKGAPWCWGDNSAGQLGRAGTASTVPVKVTLLGAAKATDLVSGDTFTCALTDAQEVQCWGKVYTGDDSAVRRIKDAGGTQTLAQAVGLASGRTHACARITDGTSTALECWGTNANHEIGDGVDTSGSPFAVRITAHALDKTGKKLDPAALGFDQVTESLGGKGYTCALRSREVYCWGRAKALVNTRVETLATNAPLYLSSADHDSLIFDSLPDVDRMLPQGRVDRGFCALEAANDGRRLVCRSAGTNKDLLLTQIPLTGLSPGEISRVVGTRATLPGSARNVPVLCLRQADAVKCFFGGARTDAPFPNASADLKPVVGLDHGVSAFDAYPAATGLRICGIESTTLKCAEGWAPPDAPALKNVVGH
ncbi:MAG TPA: hypothetical protein VL588_08640 [Bdellovibrionota bacterium]|nr:hypothetical protein [Bdellovibrionota bacterium]